MADLWTEKYKFMHRVQGMTNGLDEEIFGYLKNAFEKVSGQIVTLANKADQTESLIRKRKYLERQREQIQKVINEIYADIGKTIESTTVGLAEASPGILADMVKNTVNIQLGVPSLSKRRVKSWFESSQIEGLSIKRWLTKLSDNAVARITKEVRESLVLHESLRETTKRIQNALNISRRSATMIADTSLHSAWQWSERELYLENSDIIQKVRFTALIDRKTTELCISLDGETFPLLEAPLPPLHLKCRSSIQPLFKGEKFTGKRIARLDTEGRTVKHRDGTTSTKYEKLRVQHLPETMTHSRWVQSLVESANPKDVAFAREMLGKTRFELVKAGKFKVEKLYYHGKLRTIKELKGLMQ